MGVKLYRTYSDKNYKILQVETEIQYDKAIDIENAPYTYEETDVLIELPDEKSKTLKFNHFKVDSLI